jgi:hypothetical protein
MTDASYIVKCLLEDADADSDFSADEDSEDFKIVYQGEPEKTINYLPLGTISHGTLQPEDLIPAYISALEGVDPVNAKEMQEEYDSVRFPDPDEENNENEADYADTVDRQEFIDRLCHERLPDELQKYAPPYTYVGSHPGDGSDIGVWVNDDAIREDLEFESDYAGEESVHLQRIDLASYTDNGIKNIVGRSEYIVVQAGDADYLALLDGTTGEEIWSV